MTDEKNGASLRYKVHVQRTVPYRGGSEREVGAGRVFKLSSNENMLGPSPLALAAIREHMGSLQEYRFESDRLLREAIGLRLGLPAEQVIAGNSGMELLDLVCRGFLEEGDEAILCSPGFMAYKSFADLSGAKVVDVPLRAADFSFDMESVLGAVTERTRLLFISNPNNPTGTMIPRAVMDGLMAALPGQVLVLYDEVYHHYVQSPEYPRAIDYINKGMNLVGLHSFSKAYGLAGIRLGYAFAPPGIAAYLAHLRRPFMINTLTTVAEIAALGDSRHIRETQLLVAHEKQWLYEQLNALGIKYWKREANFILMRAPVAVDAFVAAMLREGVMVRSAEVMRAPGCVRVTLGVREANEAFVRGLLKILW
jgi:histidinol-phosphate aminotransferase